jgi:hypothetical protein
MAAGIAKTNAGRQQTTALLGQIAPVPAIAGYMGVGSGTNTPAVTDTALQTEFVTGTWAGYARAACTPTQITTSVAADTLQWQATFTAPSAVTINEVGVFNATTGGTLYIRNVFASGYALGAQDQLILTLTEQQL